LTDFKKPRNAQFSENSFCTHFEHKYRLIVLIADEWLIERNQITHDSVFESFFFVRRCNLPCEFPYLQSSIRTCPGHAREGIGIIRLS